MGFDFSKYTEDQALELMYPTQREAYLACRYGEEDILITASGGFGKSFIIEALTHYSKDDTVATGTSGVAATNINGSTTHSCLSIPLGIPTKNELAKTGRKFKSLFKRQHPIKNVIVDEFPMFGVDSLEGLLLRRDRVSKTSRHKRVRLILFGDFYQLPSPVPMETRPFLKDRYGSYKLITSDLFNQMNLKVFELDQNKRSGKDLVFTEKLEDLRQGKNLSEVLDYLNEYVRDPDPEAVYLTPRNDTADDINKEVFDRNTNTAYHYHSKVSGKFSDKDKKVPDVISLKEGLRVMSLVNDPSGEDLYVNGSCGTILALFEDCVEISFDNGNTCILEATEQENTEYYTDDEGELQKRVIGRFSQLFVRQCSAISVHKAQGLSLDKLVLDLTQGAFEFGQVYVAVSRLRSIDGLYLKVPIQLSDIKVDPDVQKWYTELRGGVWEDNPLANIPEKYHKYKIRIIVAGGRDFNDKNYAFKALDFMLKNYNKEEIFILDGGATGADRRGREYAIERGIDYETFEADWKDLTKRPCKIKENSYGQYNCLAGLVRNKEMGDLASHAVVFWDGKSTGSKHMQEYMNELGKPVKVFKY